MRNQFFVATSLANDPHTEGMHNASKIAELGGIEGVILPPSLDYNAFYEAIHLYHPRYIGLSYRQNPQVAVDEVFKVVNYLYSSGLVKPEDNVKIQVAGLPKTIEILDEKIHELPLKIELCQNSTDIRKRITETVDFFDIVKDREKIIEQIYEEVVPEGIEIFDQLADEAVRNDEYKNEPPLPIPSVKACNDYVTRIQESEIPVLRSHFGIPDETIEPTVEGIRELANARVLDEISLGSSDLSQRYFGHPQKFEILKNDGGVPYKNEEDLRRLYQASRTGNFPGVKPYCHVTDLVKFVHQCLDAGMLKGVHQAVPLFWFNELDGRGPATVRDSIKEHFECVRELAKAGIPVEMNDPNQWSSRWAHDSMIVTSYALISAVMSECGVKDMVFQMQFNKPKETGDYADLAKMSAGMEMAKRLSLGRANPARILRETRTGIESLSADMNLAKWQLARSTFLQLCMDPHIIHIVSYCEANYAARPADIIDSSKLIRRAVRIFRDNKEDIMRYTQNPIIEERKKFLIQESETLLNGIIQLSPMYQSVPLEYMASQVANPDILATAIERKIISAPGIVNKKYKGDFITKSMKYGMIDVVDSFTDPVPIRELERLHHLKTSI
ncbi:MAG: hypothetical protein HDR98_05465 [Bacteroides sp.]|nr:hypothetical protein [Bacteroides sp.]